MVTALQELPCAVAVSRNPLSIQVCFNLEKLTPEQLAEILAS